MKPTFQWPKIISRSRTDNARREKKPYLWCHLNVPVQIRVTITHRIRSRFVLFAVCLAQRVCELLWNEKKVPNEDSAADAVANVRAFSSDLTLTASTFSDLIFSLVGFGIP